MAQFAEEPEIATQDSNEGNISKDAVSTMNKGRSGRELKTILPVNVSIQEAIAEGVRRHLWNWNGKKWHPSMPKERRRRGIEVSGLLLDDRECEIPRRERQYHR
jgi:hypothetical protein